ncbi:hypothetical protein Q31a_60360 [Aureliella helgolandensis]|uniref:Ice-binding protein C-terminal domain-containing protein n=1 Tax=Aureliella helgolandensis TaxID=2527968 RepID=A0A518GGD7_9BACT|nr:hypothetical protein Q31a_60360 [Aureliella helgolandensis]
MKCFHLGCAVLLTCALVSTSQAALTVSLGVRETGGAGPAGSNAGAAGGIEWLDLDGQSFAFDGAWHTLSWDLGDTSVTAFAGATADGTLDGTWGSIEHLRILNSDGLTGPLSIYIDDMVVTTPVAPVTLTDFEGYNLDDQVMFQSPGFSGSTSSNLVAGSTSGITDESAQSGTGSYKVNFEFVDDSPTRWMRYTTFNSAVLGNPAIPLGAGNSLSISFRAVPEPSSLGLLCIGAFGFLRRRQR